MIGSQQLHTLLTFSAEQDGVLSVYLNLEPSRHIRRSYRVVFADLAKQLREHLDEAGRDRLEREVERIEQHLEAEPPRGKSLVAFSCTPRGFWQVYHLPVPVADGLYFGPTPYLRPLLDVLDEHERYAVALVDKEKARLFTVYLGEIEEERDLADFVPGKHDQGGWSQANYQRHHEAHVHWHLKRVAEALAALHRRQPFDRLVLAGPEEATSELRRLLPRTLVARLVGVFRAEIFASEAEILRQTQEIERQVERAAEEQLVVDLLEQAAPWGRATCGVAPTLDAIWQGRVHKLIVADGAQLPGSECPWCGWLEPGGSARCPLCDTVMEPVSDVIERAIERTLAEGGTVETVHGPAAARLGQAAGGLAALLRLAGPETTQEREV